MQRVDVQRREAGAASVEHVALALLVALLMLAAVAALAVSPPNDQGRALGASIARKLRCAPRLPGPCWSDALARAYGRPLGGLVRALAPEPEARIAASGLALLPVDFRYCRRESCAATGASDGLTASNRRVTAFTSVEDHRAGGGRVDRDLLALPARAGLGDGSGAEASSADVDAAAGTPLLDSDNPRLVPLETLPGRNHYDFPADEEPPWRWKVESIYPG